MNSVSTAIKLASFCRSQKPASASLSVITVIIHAIQRKPSSRNRPSIWPLGGPQIAAVRLHGKDRDGFGKAAQDLRVLGGVADPRCQIHERQLHRPLQAETRRCATESRSTAPSTRRSNLCTLTRGRLRVHRVK